MVACMPSGCPGPGSHTVLTPSSNPCTQVCKKNVATKWHCRIHDVSQTPLVWQSNCHRKDGRRATAIVEHFAYRTIARQFPITLQGQSLHAQSIRGKRERLSTTSVEFLLVSPALGEATLFKHSLVHGPLSSRSLTTLRYMGWTLNHTGRVERI